jgi:hypothetical protein
MPTKIEPLNSAEEGWLALQAENGRALVSLASNVTATGLDRAFLNWFNSRPEPASINAALNGFGVLFGELLIEASELQWVIASDEHGSDLALFGYPDRGDILIYPVNLVAKRWERGETGFFESLHSQILTSIAENQTANSRNHTR